METDFEEQSQASEAEEIAPIVIDDEGVNGNQGDDKAKDVVEAVFAVVKLMPAPVTQRMNPKRKMWGRNRKYDSMVDVDDDEELAKYDKIPVPKNKEKI